MNDNPNKDDVKRAEVDSARRLMAAKTPEEENFYRTKHETMKKIKSFKQYVKESYTQKDQNKDFDRCKRTAMKLHDKAKKEGKNPQIYRCSGYNGDTTTAHPKWKKMKPSYWSHYVTSIDGKIHDPTARQFDTSHPTEYDHEHLKKKWTEISEVKREHLQEDWKQAALIGGSTVAASALASTLRGMGPIPGAVIGATYYTLSGNLSQDLRAKIRKRRK